MMDATLFHQYLIQQGINFFAGVPDSLLKPFCTSLIENTTAGQHIIAANEGGAVGLGVGYHLATGNIPLIYMQNSGLGNTVNPLLSLADEQIYGIPMLLLIGFRGEPGVKDEPQHIKQGRVMLNMLDSMEIPYSFVSKDFDTTQEVVKSAIKDATQRSSVHALIVSKDIFAPYQLAENNNGQYQLSREQAIQCIAKHLYNNEVIVATTGMASRELFEYRVAQKQSGQRDFLTVGAMGHASQIAVGIAQARPEQNIICIDGDGAFLMHMGSAAINASLNCPNFYHFVINNAAHDSVGGQPTVGFAIDLGQIAKGAGYKSAFCITDELQLTKNMQEIFQQPGPCLIEVRVNKGARKDLGRPTTTPLENKQTLMRFLNGDKK